MYAAQSFWYVIAFALHLLGAVSALLSALWIWRMGDRSRRERGAILVALTTSAIWCTSSAAIGIHSDITLIVETFRNLSWVAVIYRMFQYDGRHISVSEIRPVIFALCLLEFFKIVMIIYANTLHILDEKIIHITNLMSMFHILESVGALVLLHNIFLGASSALREAFRWTTAAIAALWAYDLNLYAIAYMNFMPIELESIRGLVIAAISVPIAIGSNAYTSSLRLRPSRRITFQSLSLLAIGGYLLFIVTGFQLLSYLDGDAGRFMQVGYIFAASVGALLWMPSTRLKGLVRVTLVKHFFQHRYDYRSEWLRFASTIGTSDEAGQSLQVRSIKAVADITDSAGGVLFLVSGQDKMTMAAEWNWDTSAIPLDTGLLDLARLITSRSFILDLTEARAGMDFHGEAALVPKWLMDDHRAWVLVPLQHFDRLTGLILLSHPNDGHKLDWEDLDLLRVIMPQLASYLAEHESQAALMEASRFDDFNRRIAFVVHDIKNLSSQLSLVAQNAQRHADNPEFRADMLITLDKAATKLNTLLNRLNRFGAESIGDLELLNIHEIAQEVAARYKSQYPVNLVAEEGEYLAHAQREAIEQALVHLVQNAIDASTDNAPVTLELTRSDGSVQLAVIDEGKGMSQNFIRDDLFKPFVSTKNSGLGIGAFEARELIQAMNGRLSVQSQEGEGTRFEIALAAPKALENTSTVDAETDANTSKKKVGIR